jgi:hypothetical protein
MMSSVLDQMYQKGELRWEDKVDDKGRPVGYLSRTEGSCRFCVNRHWQFPNECRYGKTQETPPPSGFLERVAAQIVATGRPANPVSAAAFVLPGTPLFLKENA